MDRLVLERTQPVQGQQVDVLVLWNNEVVGELSFEFKSWLKFKKLLEKGLEMDAREDHALDLKLTVKGREHVVTGEAYPTGTGHYPGTSLEELIKHPELAELAEDDEDKVDLAAIAAAEAGSMPATNPAPTENTEEITQGLIRSLRRDNAE